MYCSSSYFEVKKETGGGGGSDMVTRPGSHRTGAGKWDASRGGTGREILGEIICLMLSCTEATPGSELYRIVMLAHGGN